jgi:hypothetical protein
VIADNVGDNVGDVAGMGADIYESLVAAVVATMAIGLTAPDSKIATLVTGDTTDARAIAVGLPIVLSAVGLLVSIVGIFVARAMRNSPPSTVLRAAMVLPPVVLVGVTAAILPLFGVSQNHGDHTGRFIVGRGQGRLSTRRISPFIKHGRNIHPKEIADEQNDDDPHTTDPGRSPCPAAARPPTIFDIRALSATLPLHLPVLPWDQVVIEPDTRPITFA